MVVIVGFEVPEDDGNGPEPCRIFPDKMCFRYPSMLASPVEYYSDRRFVWNLDWDLPIGLSTPSHHYISQNIVYSL